MYFDMKFAEVCDKIGVLLLMYARYIDDCNLAAKPIPMNLKYDPLTQSLTESSPPQNTTPAQHTMNVLRSISDNITPMLQWTCNMPDNYSSDSMPVLDLEVFKVRDIKTGLDIIGHRFYRKPTSRKTTITSSSAMPAGAKKGILIAEGLRRLLNTSPETIDDNIRQVIEEFNVDMFRSGHSHKFRVMVSSKVYRKSTECRKRKTTNLQKQKSNFR